MEVETDNSYIVKGFVVHNCDPLAGDYPKEFLWRLWHPACRCFATAIKLSKEDFEKLEDYNLGLTDKKPDIDYIEEPPKAFDDYVSSHAEQISGYANKPYWVKDNPRFVSGLLV